eukprot:2123331-Amphidinium_carterae.1
MQCATSLQTSNSGTLTFNYDICECFAVGVFYKKPERDKVQTVEGQWPVVIQTDSGLPGLMTTKAATSKIVACACTPFQQQSVLLMDTHSMASSRGAG